MKSVREIYKTGKGPSSSHTMGPERACKVFMEQHPEADEFQVILYGSLAKTGKGHGTDQVIEKTLAPFPPARAKPSGVRASSCESPAARGLFENRPSP